MRAQPGVVAYSTTAQSRDPLNLDKVAFRRWALHQALILPAVIAAVETCPMRTRRRAHRWRGLRQCLEPADNAPRMRRFKVRGARLDDRG